MRLSRREFLTTGTVSGVALTLSRLGIPDAAMADQSSFFARENMNGMAPRLRGRVDGVAKVTGAKLYISDFRAADMPGWPQQTSHALLVRATDARHVYEGLNLDALEAKARPDVVVTAAELATSGVRVPNFYKGDLLCPVGTTPLYLGQPVALLLFDTFDAYDLARTALRHMSPLHFGVETGPLPGADYATLRFTRVAGANGARDVYSPLQDGWLNPPLEDIDGRPIWQPNPKTDEAYARGATLGEEIRTALASPAAGLMVLDRNFETQSVDPMFLEPECGLAWYEPGERTLEIVLGVQSPYEVASAVAFMFGEAQMTMRPARIDGRFAYIGGGFGGRDHTPFPLYAALAAVFFPGKPIRLAHDRFQQFQGGIKRHPFRIRSQIGIDKASGKITAFAGDHVLDGGGLANYSASVAIVGATAAIGIYDIPKVDVTTVAEHSRGVPAGSMRGYGTLQTMTALETLIDEVAVELKIDPIELRRRNLLKTGGPSMTGNPWTVSVRTAEILDKLEAHPIWHERATHKDPTEKTLTGTGIACCTKDYGTGADCSLARVELAPDGAITIHTDSVEMGNGIGTAAARRVEAILGRAAFSVAVARIDTYDELDLVTTGDPYTITQNEQDAAAKNPRWVPEISTASTASIGAHVGTQAAAQAARIIFRFGMWPAAIALWGIPPGDPRAFLFEQAFWQGGELILSGFPPLAQAVVAAKAHEQKGVTGAIAHAFSRWAWAQAAFPIDGMDWAADIDALAIRRGGGSYQLLDRSFVLFPPTDYNRIGTSFTSSCGTAVRIEIDRASGALRIANAYSVLECGEALVPELVEGQAQGGFAMGVGYALFETLPPFEDGPGNGKWNLGDYVVARASDLPIHNLSIEVLPPVSPKEPPKGMAEVVMIPIVPALLNAIHDATGHRFRSLPVTANMIKGILT